MAGIDDRQWPPRSPFEAILSSPSGRKKIQQRQQNQASVSPSPIRRSRFETKIPEIMNHDEEAEEDEDEDEETLQLKLQALEAKLKLKRLQNKKARDGARRDDAGKEDQPAITRPRSGTLDRESGAASNGGLYRSKSSADIQVPLSPERRPVIQQEPKSPGRILLGIDKGLSADKVSLRRPPALRNGAANADPFGPTIDSSRAKSTTGSRRYLSPEDHTRAPVSFNERMSQSRETEKAEKERQARLAKARAERSTGFNVRKEEINAFREAVESAPASQRLENHRRTKDFSREDILKAANRPEGGLVRRSNTTSLISNGRTSRAQSSLGQSRPTSAAVSRNERPKSREVSLSDESRPNTPDPALFEGFSRLNLSTRVLPHSFVARMVEDKAAITLPVLLKDIKAPDFSLPPELEEKDIVVFATIASKTEPRAHKQTNQASKSTEVKTAKQLAEESEANQNGNYMIFTLTDLKWTVELFLFQTAFTRWHKLQPGTVVAILNPSIMPPPKGRADTGRWSLTLNSSDDTVLEIGTSKDLGWCKAKTKDGRPCSDWVDARKTEFCEYHVGLGVAGLRRGRMEVQGMSAPFGPGGNTGGGLGRLNSMRGRKGHQAKDDGLLREGRQFDRSTQSSYFMVSRHASTANLLDADENGDLHGSKEERQRKLFAEQEREREIAFKLGRGMSGAGAEYHRARNGDILPSAKSTATTSDQGDCLDARALGLRSNAATNVMLSPLKRKPSIRAVSNSSSSNGTEPGPQRKKTRFITEKGIREAGRESIGGEGIVVGMHMNDDDELDIV